MEWWPSNFKYRHEPWCRLQPFSSILTLTTDKNVPQKRYSKNSNNEKLYDRITIQTILSVALSIWSSSLPRNESIERVAAEAKCTHQSSTYWSGAELGWQLQTEHNFAITPPEKVKRLKSAKQCSINTLVLFNDDICLHSANLFSQSYLAVFRKILWNESWHWMHLKRLTLEKTIAALNFRAKIFHFCNWDMKGFPRELNTFEITANSSVISPNWLLL